MAKCNLSIKLDSPDGSLRCGEAITGKVLVEIDEDCTCKALTLDYYWRTCRGGERNFGAAQSYLLHAGEWKAGSRASYQFSVDSADSPPSYSGLGFSVEHMLEVRADIPWAFDPKAARTVLLRPARVRLDPEQGRDKDLDDVERSSMLGQLAPSRVSLRVISIGIAVLFLGMVTCPGRIGASRGPLLFSGLSAGHLIAVAVLVLAYVIYKSGWLAERLIGKVNVRSRGGTLAPGHDSEIEVGFTPRKAGQLNQISATLVGWESYFTGGGGMTVASSFGVGSFGHSSLSRSGSKRRHHTREIARQPYLLLGPQEITAGRQVRAKAALPIPDGLAPSFTAGTSSVCWKLEVHIDVARWPDWKRSHSVQMVHAWDEVDAAPEPRHDTPPMQPAQRMPQAPTPVQPLPVSEHAPLGTTTASETETAEPELSSMPSRTPPSLPAVKPGSDRSASTKSQRSLVAVVDAALALGKDRDRIDALIAEAAGSTYVLVLDVQESLDSYGFALDACHEGGRTVKAGLAGYETEVSVRLCASRNAEVDALEEGGTVRVEARPRSWDGLYRRLELDEVQA